MVHLLHSEKSQKNEDVEAFLKQFEAKTGIDVLARYAHPKGRKPRWKSAKLHAEWDEGQFALGRSVSFKRVARPIMDFSAAEIGGFEIVRVPDDYLTPYAHLGQMSLAVSLVFTIVEQISDVPDYVGGVAVVVVCAIYLIATAASRRTLTPAIRLTISSPSSKHTWVELRKKDFSLLTHAKDTRKMADQFAETLEKSGFRGGIPPDLTYDPIWEVNRAPAIVRNGLIIGLIAIKLGVEMIPPIVQTIAYWVERLFS